MVAGNVTESCRAVTCLRVLQDLEVSLGPWGAVWAQVQGQDQGSHLRAPGIRSCQGAAQLGLLFRQASQEPRVTMGQDCRQQEHSPTVPKQEEQMQ